MFDLTPHHCGSFLRCRGACVKRLFDWLGGRRGDRRFAWLGGRRGDRRFAWLGGRRSDRRFSSRGSKAVPTFRHVVYTFSARARQFKRTGMPG